MGRKIQIKIRLDEEEHSALMAKKGSMRLAPWLRACALGSTPFQVPPINSQAVAELGKIGSNLNQLAKFANRSGGFDLDHKELKTEMAALRLALQAGSA